MENDHTSSDTNQAVNDTPMEAQEGTTKPESTAAVSHDEASAVNKTDRLEESASSKPSSTTKENEPSEQHVSDRARAKGAPVPPTRASYESDPQSAQSRKRLPKRSIVGIAAAAIAIVVALCVANALGAFHQHTWKDATCTEPKTCTECGATEGDPLGHDYQEQDVAATCTQAGKKIFTCSRCDDQYTEPDGTPATGHTPGDWTFDYTTSKMVQRCTVCGETVDSRDLTRDDIDQAVSTQELTLDSCKKEIQNPNYKALYPDMVAIRVTNHSDKVIRSASVRLCAWDENCYPVACKMAYSFWGNNSSALASLDDINLMPGAAWDSDTEGKGWALDANSTDNIATVKGIVESIDYADGTKWANPYLDAWLGLYENQQL